MAPSLNSVPTSPQKPSSSATAKTHRRERQTKIEFFNADSLTGHQTYGGVSKPSSYLRSRQAKVNAQLKSRPEALLAFAKSDTAPTSLKRPQIFKGCKFHLMGAFIDVSGDHRLKQDLASHGATIIGPGNGIGATHHIVEEGSGGRTLAAGKMQKWVEKKRVNTSVKFVTVKWVLDSMNEGKRLPESRYLPSHGGMKAAGQKNIMGMFAEKY